MRDLACGDLRIHLEVEVRRVNCRRGGGVTQERLDGLAANPHDTKRFALYVGKQCRGASIKEVADDLRLDWHAGNVEVHAMDGSRDISGCENGVRYQPSRELARLLNGLTVMPRSTSSMTITWSSVTP